MGIIWQKALGGKLRLASNFSIFSEKASVYYTCAIWRPSLKGFKCVLFNWAASTCSAIPVSCTVFFLCRAAVGGQNPAERKTGHSGFSAQIQEMFQSMTLLAVPAVTCGCTAPGFWKQVGKLSPSTQQMMLLTRQCLNSCPFPLGRLWFGVCVQR